MGMYRLKTDTPTLRSSSAFHTLKLLDPAGNQSSLNHRLYRFFVSTSSNISWSSEDRSRHVLLLEVYKDLPFRNQDHIAHGHHV